MKPDVLLREALDMIAPHVGVIDRHGVVVAVNDAWTEFARRMTDPVSVPGPGDNYLAFVTAMEGGCPELGRRVVEGVHAVLGGWSEEFAIEFGLPDPAGERRMQLSVKPLRDGDATYACVAHYDVTAWRQYEELATSFGGQLSAGRSLLEAILELVPGPVVVAESPSGRVLLANEHVQELLGDDYVPSRSVEEYSRFPTHQPGGATVPPSRWPLTRAVEGGETIRGEHCVVTRADGSEVHLLVSARPVMNEHGEPFASTALAVDITERIELNRKLRQAEQRFQSVWDATPTAMLFTDERARVLGGNRAFEDLTGCPPEEIRGRSLTEMFEAGAGMASRYAEVLRQDAPVERLRVVFTPPRGGERHVLLSLRSRTGDPDLPPLVVATLEPATGEAAPGA